jgi:peptide/nickel transport system ATP-binding protein
LGGATLAPVGVQAGSALRVHQRLDRNERHRRIVELFARVGLRDPEQVYHRYPHELSGGMCQRVLIAAALSTSPTLMVADEPTSALDVTVQKTILDLIDELADEYGLGVLLVTHDLGVAADRADSLLVLSGGRTVEQGPTAAIVERPQARYTRDLIAASALGPVRDREPPLAAASDLAIVVESVSRSFVVRRRSGAQRIDALKAVSLSVGRGSTLGVVGESGSGKTTLARILVGLDRPDTGRVLIDGVPVHASSRWSRRRHAALQFVYQNPFASLDPRLSVSALLEEPLTGHSSLDRRGRGQRILDLLEQVELPIKTLHQMPSELSGGQRQRVAIARALAPGPSILVLDEPVSALDSSVQAKVLDLLDTLQRRLALTYLFISHDLSVIRAICDRVAVLHHGDLVETGLTAEVLRTPRTSYVRQLIDAIPGARFRAAAVDEDSRWARSALR